MKKFNYIVTTLLAAIVLMCSTTVLASDVIFEVPDNISVNDFSKVIQPSTKNYIQSSNDVLMNETQSKIIFAIVPTTGAEPIDEYAKRLYNAWSVAYIGDNSSVFILLATDDMQYWPIIGSHIESALTPDIVNDYLLKFLEPDFANKDFDAAIRKTYDAFSNWYSGTFNTMLANTPDVSEDSNKNGIKIPWGTIFGTLFKILLVAAVILLIIAARLRRKIRLQQIEQRKRMRRANIEKYRRAEPTEHYSFSYSAIRDDDDM